MTADHADVLLHVDLFADLGDQERATLAGVCQEVRVKRGEIVVEQGAEGDALYVVVAGSLSVAVTSGAGDRAVLRKLTARGTFGELSLLDGGSRSASVIADEESLLLRLPREDFLQLLDDTVLARAVLAGMAQLMRRLTDQAGDFVFLDLAGRIAKTLSTLAEQERPGDGEVYVEVTQRRLAEIVGATRQSVNQALAGFSQRGLVEVEGRGVRVIDRPGLRKRAGMG